MPPTYSQLIESALTDAAKENRARFGLTWLRQQIRTRAKKAKKPLGPHLNKAILRVLNDGARLGYFHLKYGRRANDISIHMTEGGRHEYTQNTTTVTVEARVSTAKTRDELQRENDGLRSKLLKIETRLARTNSLFNIENSGHVEIVTGTPEAIIERTKRLIALSKNRKHQIELMYEEERYQYNVQLLNEYFEYDMREREERDALIRAYQEWDAEEDPHAAAP